VSTAGQRWQRKPGRIAYGRCVPYFFAAYERALIREALQERWVYLPALALVEEHLWTLLLCCPRCQRGMRGNRRIRRRQRGAEYLEHQYHCKDARPSRNPGEHVCNPTYYDAQTAERTVTNALLTVARRPEFLHAALSAYRQRHRSGYSQEEHQRL
jgi:hypothetical protein